MFTDRNWHLATWDSYEKERIINVQAHRELCPVKMAALQIWVCPGPHTKGQDYTLGRRRRAKGKTPLRRPVLASAQPFKLYGPWKSLQSPLPPRTYHGKSQSVGKSELGPCCCCCTNSESSFRFLWLLCRVLPLLWFQH